MAIENMLRLLFLENRGITEIWSRVASVLKTDAHCSLLRFNTVYGADFPGRVIDLRAANDGPKFEPYIETLLETLYSTDRASYLYGAKKCEMRRAARSVLQALDELRFDAVIGEVTSIYERVVSAYCRTRNIPFLAPMTARIPVDRFFFLDGGNAFPLPISTAGCSATDGGKVAGKKAGHNDLAQATRPYARVLSLLYSFKGWLHGERLHTPSPWRRAALNWARYNAHRQISRVAQQLEAIGPESVVYCMHVQPESTLETYSPEHCDQGAVIRALAKACTVARRPFIVRPHPRGRDEMHLHLQRVVGEQAILSARVAMAEILALRPTIVTVTGTVLMEAALAGAPAVALGRSYLNTFPGVQEVPINEFDKVLSGERRLCCGTAIEQQTWFESMARFTHAGIIAPPEWDDEVLSCGNIRDIACAVRSAMTWLKQHSGSG